MRLVDAISNKVNYSLTWVDQQVKNVVTYPRATKKVLQIATKIFAARDLYYSGKVHERPVTEAMKGSVELIEFYGLYKDILFWMNPFSKDTLDQEALLKSLTLNLCKEQAAQICKEVLNQETFSSKGQVLEALQVSLENQGYQTQIAQALAESVIIKQKARPITLLFAMVCFTAADLAGNLQTLKKWGIADLSVIAAQVGQTKILMFVFKFGAETVLSTVVCAGLFVSAGEAAYRTVVHAVKHYQAVEIKDKEKVYKELKEALLDLAANGVDLISVATPLLFTLNPPVLVALAIFAKGTGLICILVTQGLKGKNSNLAH